VVIYVLDASAILRYLDGETGAERVSQIIKGHLAGTHRVVVSAIHWGEVAGIVSKRHGRGKMEDALSRLVAFGFEMVPVTADRAVKSALIKVERKIPYADAFGVELAGDSAEHVLVTADFDVKAAEDDVRIEFLPVKGGR
jgi:predicted nucleic acid-binding protein